MPAAPSLSVPGMPSDFGTLLSFVKAPLAVVADEVIDWHNGLDFNPSRVDLPNGLAEHATSLLPLEDYPARRDLLVGTKGDEWTAFFDSFRVGNNPSGGGRVIAGRLGVDSVQIWLKTFTDERTDPRKEPGFLTPGRGKLGPGITRLEYNHPGELPRIIALYERYTASSRYELSLKGAEQSWEDITHYNQRLKRDRFTPEILDSYCRRLGIDAFSLDFYSGPSVFTERSLDIPPDTRMPAPSKLRSLIAKLTRHQKHFPPSGRHRL